MIELPAELVAAPDDREEAAAVVARIAGPNGSVVAALAHDLVDGVAGRPVTVTATDEIAVLAAAYWMSALNSAGANVGGHTSASPSPARIHLHGEVAVGSGYPGADVLHDGPWDLVGEVVAQGESAAARYLSLVAIADAVVRALTAGSGSANS